MEPSYIKLYRSGELERRYLKADSLLENCTCCPRECGVNRNKDILGICKTGSCATVPYYGLHFGEEPVISGLRGSGNIFFGNCNLSCVYCQNFQISQNNESLRHASVSSRKLAEIMMELQNQGAHNINLVSPSHVVPHIIKGLFHAASMGLNIPVVYNSNGYDSLASLRLLDKIVDIYLPDVKYANNRNAFRYSRARNYLYVVKKALIEMYNQVGILKTDKNGIAQKGLIIRHLILPFNIAGTYESLKFVADILSCNIPVSIMTQYYPTHRAARFPELNREINEEEYEGIIEIVNFLNLKSGWIQELGSSKMFRPDFTRKKVF